MEAVNQTSSLTAKSLEQIMKLRNDCEGKRIIHLGKRLPMAKKLLDYLFTQQAITATDIAEILDISLVSTYKMIDEFIRVNILQEGSGFKRKRNFIFRESMDLFHKL